MKFEQLPLLEIFNSLRQRHGFPLGIEEYLTLVHCLQGGFGLNSRLELEELCCVLWSKSPVESQLIHNLFEQMWLNLEYYPQPTQQEKDTSLKNNSKKLSNNKISPQQEKSNNLKNEIKSKNDNKISFLDTLLSKINRVITTLFKPPSSLKTSQEKKNDDFQNKIKSDNNTSLENNSKTSQEKRNENTFKNNTINSKSEKLADLDLEIDEPVQVVKAVRNTWQRSNILFNDYFPITRRQMKQIWRYLRRSIREGVPTELDLEETVSKIGKEGILLEPILIPPKVNNTDLILMIDQEGSMTPFHALSQQLLETAIRGGKLKQTRVYYFHNYVDEYIYQDSALVNGQPLNEILAKVGKRAAVLIFSDAGAARGYCNENRVKRSLDWLETLKKSVKYLAWLNPMPKESWQNTSAEQISSIVSMFEMDLEGMNMAIGVLRGKDIR